MVLFSKHESKLTKSPYFLSPNLLWQQNVLKTIKSKKE